MMMITLMNDNDMGKRSLTLFQVKGTEQGEGICAERGDGVEMFKRERAASELGLVSKN